MEQSTLALGTDTEADRTVAADVVERADETELEITVQISADRAIAPTDLQALLSPDTDTDSDTENESEGDTFDTSDTSDASNTTGTSTEPPERPDPEEAEIDVTSFQKGSQTPLLLRVIENADNEWVNVKDVRQITPDSAGIDDGQFSKLLWALADDGLCEKRDGETFNEYRLSDEGKIAIAAYENRYGEEAYDHVDVALHP